MGFFNNVKNIKDKALEYECLPDIDPLQGVFEIIDDQADLERERKRAEREHFESLSIEDKVEYKRIEKRNKRLKRLGLYGLTVAGMASGVGIPVLMAANVGAILADDDLTFDQDAHDARVRKLKGKEAKGLPDKRPREYYKISYDKEGHPKVSTLVDVDPYNLEERYEMLMRGL
ncbi:hypothetical protein [Methanobrevibacter sp.]|uniref:hypothetical protein n=1 Tax=Methanobrevibacter sp. TaxID=66852 RepID=UPI002E7619A2|nr:hypothetical protein [Methanobrevibacter sp.]MEE1336469.1 hypothetical protein [Methanobrevibacter sp.]